VGRVEKGGVGVNKMERSATFRLGGPHLRARLYSANNNNSSSSSSNSRRHRTLTSDR